MDYDKLNSQGTIDIIISGGRTESHTINAQVLGETILGINTIISRANSLINDEVQCNINIDANFTPGSFDFRVLIDQISNNVIPLLAGDPATAFINFQTMFSIIFGSDAMSIISAIKTLKGDNIVAVEEKDEKVLVISDGGKSLEIFKEGKSLIEDTKFIDALSRSVMSMLSADGGETVAFYSPELKDTTKINRDEIDSFKLPQTDSDEIILDETLDCTLEIISMSFRPDRKWEFKSHSDSFYAEIECGETFYDFLEKETFEKGDRLKVELNTIITKPHQRIIKRRIVKNIYGHEKAIPQIEIDFKST